MPLPPDHPAYNLPANNATGVPTTGVSLSFYAGLWAHLYDIYFGTTPNPPLLETDRRLGPSQWSTDYRYYALPPLQPGDALLLEDRLEDDGAHRPPTAGLELHAPRARAAEQRAADASA